MSNFQIILITVFSVIILIAVLMFAGIIPGFRMGGGAAPGPEISVWGRFDGSVMRPLVEQLNQANKELFKMDYTEKKTSGYENAIVNAMAAGAGPDAFVITQDAVLWAKDKIQILPFESFSERDYRDTFFDSAALFLDIGDGGIAAMPLAVDPIVLYWNKDLFSAAGLARPPEYWDEFLSAARATTKADAAGNILQAGAALGEFRNVKNAKEILSMMIMQTGNKIIDPVSLKVVLGTRGSAPLDPAESGVRFFNEFSDQGKSSYSWNRALPSSDVMFTNGGLAMYFGYASEMNEIRKRNPHLNFDAAPAPQIRGGAVKAAFGRIYALAVSKMSPRKQAAFSAAFKMSGAEFNGRLAEALSMAPVRRDLLAQGSSDPFFSVFFKSAIMARAWLEPDRDEVYRIFKDMAESAATGRLRLSSAVQDARNRLEKLAGEYRP